MSNKSLSVKNDTGMSVNVAYGQVNHPMVSETSALPPPEVQHIG